MFEADTTKKVLIAIALFSRGTLRPIPNARVFIETEVDGNKIPLVNEETGPTGLLLAFYDYVGDVPILLRVRKAGGGLFICPIEARYVIREDGFSRVVFAEVERDETALEGSV